MPFDSLICRLEITKEKLSELEQKLPKVKRKKKKKKWKIEQNIQ